MRCTRRILLAGLIVFVAACGSGDGDIGAAQADVQGATTQAVDSASTAAPTTTAATTTSASEPEPVVTADEEPPRRQELAMRNLTIPGNPEVPNTLATLEATDDEVEVIVTTNGLTPGNPMTAWIFALDAEACAEAFPAFNPCQPFVLTAGDRPDLGNVRYLGGGIPADDGSITIAGRVTKHGLPAETPDGELQWWFDTEIESFRDMVYHVIMKDHGPPIEGMVEEMSQTFRGGCTDDSFGPAEPDNAMADGAPGPNICIDSQAVLFEPEGIADPDPGLYLDVQIGTLTIEPATVPAAGEHELTISGKNFLGGTGIVILPCITPGAPMVFGELTLGESNSRLGAIDPLVDCYLDQSIEVAVELDGTFTVTAIMDVTGTPDPALPDGTNFAIGAGSLDGSQDGRVWLPVVPEG